MDRATTPRPKEHAMAGSRVRCVCFDWGGVILRHCRSWNEACAHAGIPVRAGFDVPELVARRRQINHDFQLGAMDARTFFNAIADATAGLYTPDEVIQVHRAWLTSEYDGLAEIIQSLNRSARVQTALLSNTNEAHWARHLPTDGRPPDFPTIGLINHRHASHLLGHAKPGEDIYRAFEAATGFVPEEILFFDDMPDNVATARRLGWRAEAIDHTRETAPQIGELLRRHDVV
jgi:FMN phosphatase YigB (HAD superfamily)